MCYVLKLVAEADNIQTRGLDNLHNAKNEPNNTVNQGAWELDKTNLLSAADVSFLMSSSHY